jgi:hypothetical protein
MPLMVSIRKFEDKKAGSIAKLIEVRLIATV